MEKAEKENKMKKRLFYIERKSPAALLSVIFMLAAALIRIIYFWGREAAAFELFIHLYLVLAASIVFCLTVLFLGKKAPELTSLSVLLGVIFFSVKAFTFESKIHTYLCLLLYAAVLLLYSMTIFGIIKTKKLLYPLFLLPLLYHIFVEDMQVYILARPMPPFIQWLPEVSVLCIMAALLSVSFAIRER